MPVSNKRSCDSSFVQQLNTPCASSSDRRSKKAPAKSVEKSKGLRYFSARVCEKVRENGVTNYNKLADELVREYFSSMTNPPRSKEEQLYDQKNIRRRVYDALNVLMATDVIVKEKKEIRWVGLPSRSAPRLSVQPDDARLKAVERIRQKEELLAEYLSLICAHNRLIERNKEWEKVNGSPPANHVIPLPLVIASTSKRTKVECVVPANRDRCILKFNDKFRLYNDYDVMQRMGLTCNVQTDQLTPESILELTKYLPECLKGRVSGNCIVSKI